MDVETSSESALAASTAPKKRTRVLLSCAPCRASKLKCDRQQPCVQCAKKGRLDLCVYAPKPEKKRPMTKGMSARLKRLEGMVRDMMDDQGNLVAPGAPVGSNAAPPLRGQVVHGERATTTYVGATHCLAMLEDIEDMKSYFDDPDDSDDDSLPKEDPDTPDMLPFGRGWGGGPRNREELLALLPEKHVSDRIVTRYFSAKTPSQFVIHRPTFTKAYTRFWQDHDSASLHWISLLFTILARGVYHNSFLAPFEVSHDSPTPIKDRVKQYRACAAYALSLGKYIQPTPDTMIAFILYVESDFVLNLAEQTNCYLLAGVCLRLMLKMGYHRDPSKLANISPFEGEMRRRHWCMGTQLDTLVSFHMGLPPLAYGLETDTLPPQNLEDVDFGPESTELPPPRPVSDYTFMSYTIHKRLILEAFTKIAHQAHRLSPPTYADVLHLDKVLNEAWSSVPPYLHVRPLDECVGDPPYQIIQRFGIASLHHKSVCVLHRRYLAEPTPTPEHNYSRQRCLESAVTLLDFQYATWEGCRPGNILGPSAWFMSSLAIHDFMLAAVILYVIIQSDNYADDGTGFGLPNDKTPSPRKSELTMMIRRSYDISCQVFRDPTDQKKTVFALSFMLERLGCPVNSTPGTLNIPLHEQHSTPSDAFFSGHSNASTSPAGNASTSYSQAGDLQASRTTTRPPATTMASSSTSFLTMGSKPSSMGVSLGLDMSMCMSMGEQSTMASNPDFSWMLLTENNVDWRHLDASIGQYGYQAGAQSAGGQQPPAGADAFPLDMDLDRQLWNAGNGHMPSAGNGHGN
ncbi:putative transcriptional regulatory protein [Escovopsis weberi]|uniref:Putative transcriptional regulatory protein n=1 Tax=Escovopsis weberi TaxID=150374 RepID=A0A0M9VTD6_ESCWE|nr:putative transcriptional regulatory protein [Escovopsis weberi]